MAEIYDPKTGKFVHRADMTPRLDMCSGTLLADGRVFHPRQPNRLLGTMNEAPKWAGRFSTILTRIATRPCPISHSISPSPVAALDGAGKVLDIR